MKEYTTEEKAEMFDKIFSCDRIRLLGMAREDGTGREGDATIRHIGIEFWTNYKLTEEEFEKHDQRDFFLEFLSQIEEKK